MYLPTAILGKHVVDKLEARQSSAVLTIGDDRFTRPMLSKLGCFNFTAAARLTRLITIELKVKNTRDLYLNVPPQHLAIPGLGAICLATIGAAFESKGLGTLGDYVARHTLKGVSIITFSTMKTNILDAAAAKDEKRALAKRKASRNAKAHELRVERHVTRAAKTNGTTGNGKANGVS